MDTRWNTDKGSNFYVGSNGELLPVPTEFYNENHGDDGRFESGPGGTGSHSKEVHDLVQSKQREYSSTIDHLKDKASKIRVAGVVGEDISYGRKFPVDELKKELGNHKFIEYDLSAPNGMFDESHANSIKSLFRDIDRHYQDAERSIDASSSGFYIGSQKVKDATNSLEQARLTRSRLNSFIDNVNRSSAAPKPPASSTYIEGGKPAERWERANGEVYEKDSSGKWTRVK